MMTLVVVFWSVVSVSVFASFRVFLALVSSAVLARLRFHLLMLSPTLLLQQPAFLHPTVPKQAKATTTCVIE